MTHDRILLEHARKGLGFTPDELNAIQQRIDAAATAEKIGASEAATKKTVYVAVGVAAIAGGLLGGYIGSRRF
jgi:hypothetical protein